MRAASLHRGFDLRLRRAAHLHAVADVLGDRHMRIERVVLEHHRAIAQARAAAAVTSRSPMRMLPGGRLQPGDHAQRRGLAAARRPDQHDEFLVRDLEIERGDDGHRAEGLGDVCEADARHAGPFRAAGPAALRGRADMCMLLLRAAGPSRRDRRRAACRGRTRRSAGSTPAATASSACLRRRLAGQRLGQLDLQQLRCRRSSPAGACRAPRSWRSTESAWAPRYSLASRSVKSFDHSARFVRVADSGRD